MTGKMISYEEFKDRLAHAELGYPDHALVNVDINLDSSNDVLELLDTGSVTITVNGRNYELAIFVKEFS